jgi:hypothetical protein
MKTIKYILASLAIVLVAASCVKDLNVTPIDPNKNTADKALVSEQDFEAFLAGIYTGYATSGYYGPNGDPSIKGLDGGMSQYIRGLFHLCELPTDVYVCGWNDEGVPDVCKMQWDASTGLIYSIYSRMFFQVAQCNEFIRQAQQTNLAFESKDQMIAEARALRALSYYHAIDNFGNVPFADETSVVGSLPGKKTRTELYEWLETELRDIIDNSKLPDPKRGQYGRIDKGAAKMVLAKLYLNAQVYTGTAQWEKCAGVVKDLMDDGYSLHTTPRGLYTAYQDLFLADNDQCTDEIIFAVQQDGLYTQSYGVTNYIIFASTGGEMDPDAIGISSGWGGLRMTPEFYAKFSNDDQRKLFYTATQKASIDDIGEFSNGYAFMKFLNRTSTGDYGQEMGFVDTDFPLMRYADVLLMAAECQARGASIDGLSAFNQVRERAGLNPVFALNLDDILDERARELYQECWRRNDLIRFGKFTSGYTWQWKGEVRDGRDVESHRTLFPIPDSDRLANSNLKQNPGY